MRASDSFCIIELLRMLEEGTTNEGMTHSTVAHPALVARRVVMSTCANRMMLAMHLNQWFRGEEM
jgi:hypothetical protein